MTSTQVSNNITYEYALNEYYKLKSLYDTEIKDYIRTEIIKSKKEMTRREKKNKYLEFKPKCVNCKRPVGTVFTSKYGKHDPNQQYFRLLSATCGDITNPCNLNIKINVGGNVEVLSDLIEELEESIQILKNELIKDKNDLIFGMGNSEQAIEDAITKFEKIKKEIDDLSQSYSFYLEDLMFLSEGSNTELQEKESFLFERIQQIKSSISQFESTGNTQFVKDAVEVYINQLSPYHNIETTSDSSSPPENRLLKQIRDMKYKECKVIFDSTNDVFRLIQEKYTIPSTEVENVEHGLIEFKYGISSSTSTSTSRIETSENISWADSDENTRSSINSSNSSQSKNKTLKLRPFSGRQTRKNRDKEGEFSKEGADDERKTMNDIFGSDNDNTPTAIASSGEISENIGKITLITEEKKNEDEERE